MNGPRGKEGVTGSQDQRCFHNIVGLNEVGDIHNGGVGGNTKNHAFHDSHVGVSQPKICCESDDGLRCKKHSANCIIVFRGLAGLKGKV